jgi:chromatin remodeling complex protein RSC6
MATALKRKTVSFRTMAKAVEALIKSPGNVVGYDREGNWIGYAAKRPARVTTKRSKREESDAGDDFDADAGDDFDDDDEEDDNDDERDVLPSGERAGSSGKRSGPKKAKLAGTVPRNAVVLKPALAAIVGASVTTRGQLGKWMWARIRSMGLQKPSDRRVVVYDEALAAALKRKTGTIFSMNKHLADNVVPATREQAADCQQLIPADAAPEAPSD